ncbi:hypothetical protein XENOCAPTIV_028351, partial [Xenoophorus captivus]
MLTGCLCFSLSFTQYWEDRPINLWRETDGNRADSPTPSRVSMKSDVSKDLPLFFRNGPGPPEQR